MDTDELHVIEHRTDDPDAPIVVLVHGVLDSVESFAAVTELLPDLSLLTYDRRGWGKSRRAVPAESLSDHADDLLAVIGERPATVVAHSFGGNVAMLAAIRRPDLVRSLGLFEPPVMWAEWWPDWETQRAQSTKVRHHFAAGMEGRPKRSAEQRRVDAEMLQADLAMVRTPPYEFDAIGVPCLVGRSSETAPYHINSADKLAEVLGAPLFVIEDAGHTAHRTHPREFAAFVRDALALAGGRA